VGRHAAAILGKPALARFFDPGLHKRSRDAVALVLDGQVQRFDRVVECDEAVWFLAFLPDADDDALARHGRRLAQHAGALESLYPGRRIRGAVIGRDGSLREAD
jgi:hypothetical protein